MAKKKATTKKTKAKKSGIHLEKEIKAWAKQQNYDVDTAIEKWVGIRKTYSDEPESDDKDLKCYQELVLAMQTESANIFVGRPPIPISGYIVGATDPWLKNEDSIKKLMAQYNSGNIPVDKDNRPLIVVREGVPVPVAYNRKGGVFDLKAKKEVKFAFYGAPEGQADMIVEITASGEITNGKGVKEWFADYIGDIPVNRRVNLNIDVSDYGTFVHKTPIIDGIYFEELEYDDGETIIDVFEEIAEGSDYIDFEEIEDYATDSPYTLFVSEGSVIDVGSPSSTGNVALSIGQSVKVLFGKVATEPVVGWVSEELVKRAGVKKGDKVKFVAKAWFDKAGKFKVSIFNVLGDTEPEVNLFNGDEEEEEPQSLEELLDEEEEDEEEDDEEEDDEEEGADALDLF